MAKLYGIFAVLVLLGAIFAAEADGIAAGKQLVDSKANCSTLSSDQLETIGDYIMELQHPGPAHAYMETMMGGEGSESLKNAHIQMAQVLYCGRTDVPVTYGGMMGMGALGYSGGMMGGYGGMMGRVATATPYSYGMMGNYGYSAGYGISLVDVLLIVLLIGLIIAVYAYIWQAFHKGKEKKQSR